MKIEIAQFTFATPDLERLRDFYAGILGDEGVVEDHEFYFTLYDGGKGGCLAVVPHNGDEMWDKPWVTFATDDMAGALKHLASLGITEMDSCGPVDDEGNPTACVTFRDPDGRLVMLAIA